MQMIKNKRRQFSTRWKWIFHFFLFGVIFAWRLSTKNTVKIVWLQFTRRILNSTLRKMLELNGKMLLKLKHLGKKRGIYIAVRIKRPCNFQRVTRAANISRHVCNKKRSLDSAWTEKKGHPKHVMNFIILRIGWN